MPFDTNLSFAKISSLVIKSLASASEGREEVVGRIDNLEAITMTATTTQMGRPGGGSSHTPRLNTQT